MEGVNDRIWFPHVKAKQSFCATMSLCVTAHECKWKDLLWDSGDNMRGPVVNWKNVPAYNLAKFIATNIGKYVPLPNAFNVRNSIDLISDIKKINPDENLRFVSFDIQNMYTNIPIEDLIDSIDKELKQNNTDTCTRLEIVRSCEVVLKRNYFQYDNTLYMQADGLAMGCPTSSVFSEIYLQRLEHLKIVDF
ncbi:hypothetical protein Cfor_05813 [Coptotermes formosanus]|uniref:Reverse transcriptase domain-containing protein n=1 Tax=Coptotermes formosanus TaxID=36987 RepID=A0A6L2PAV3_COPFO|nr:hypothetical protein Cfor_05813 [Coptotermes formosanus]